MKSELHKKLQREALYWLYKNGCVVYGEEVGVGGLILDVVGLKENGDSYCVEVKANQSDLEKARQEGYARNNHYCNYHYLWVASDLTINYYWEGWGIIKDGHSIKKAKRFDSPRHFSETIKLLFNIGGALARKFYFNNFRDSSV